MPVFVTQKEGFSDKLEQKFSVDLWALCQFTRAFAFPYLLACLRVHLAINLNTAPNFRCNWLSTLVRIIFWTEDLLQLHFLGESTRRDLLTCLSIQWDHRCALKWQRIEFKENSELSCKLNWNSWMINVGLTNTQRSRQKTFWISKAAEFNTNSWTAR